MKWQDVFVKARLIVRKKAVYYTNTLLSLVPYETNQIKCMGVTKGLTLLFNPTYVEEQTAESCAGLFVHEIHHVARKHHIRVDRAIASLGHIPNIRYVANVAADIAINPHVKAEGWELPDGGFFPEDFDFPVNLLFEEYLRKLLEMGEQLQQVPKVQQQQKEAEANGDESPGGPASGRCGGVSGNSLGGIEDKADAEVGRSASEVVSIATNQAREIERAYTKAGRGSLPLDIKESITLTGKSRMPYDQLLGRYLQDELSQAERGMEIFSRRVPSRKSFVTGVVRAGLLTGIPDVAIIFDTSGSMGEKQLSACLRETVGVLQRCNIEEVWLLQADARVAIKPRRVRVGDLRKLDMHGRGGTSFQPALDALAELRPRPPVAIYFTDGDGAAARKPPGIDVIWAVVASRWSRKPDAAFGKVVMLPD